MTILRFHFISYFYLIGSITWVYGQQQNILFESLPIELPSHSVRTLMRDSWGYMWFGTSGGLVRYDGLTSYVYEKGSKVDNGLSQNGINAIIEDETSNIWVGTSAGLNLYDRERDRFVNPSANHTEMLGNAYIKALQTDSVGRLWIATLYNGLLIYDYHADSLIQYLHDPNDPKSLSSNDVLCLSITPNQVWIATKNGLDRFSPVTRQFQRIQPALKGKEAEFNNISALKSDKNGRLWIGTWSGLYYGEFIQQDFSMKQFTVSKDDVSLSEAVILSLCMDNQRKLWVGTESIGLNCIDLDTYDITNYSHVEGDPQTISGNSIWSIYSDQEGILWIGVYSQGVNLVNSKIRKFKLLSRNPLNENSLPDNDVRGLALDVEGKIWIATDNGGVCQFNPQTRIIEAKLNSKSGKVRLNDDGVMAILYDTKKQLWLGTWTKGVDLVSEDRQRVKNYSVEGEIKTGNNKVISLFEDSQGTIWAGTSGSGLFYYDKVNDRFKQFVNSNDAAPKNDSYVTSFAEDKDGTLWIGTMYGLVALKKNKDGSRHGEVLLASEQPGSISDNLICVIFRDSKNRLWFGTGNNGINRLQPDGSFACYNSREGLIGNAVRSIQEDQQGLLWITTSKGLSKFNPETLEFQNFTKSDGLSEGFYVHSSLRIASGEIFFGGKDGLNSFHPGDINPNDYIPEIYLTDFKINGKSVAVSDEENSSPLAKHISLTHSVTLSHFQNSIIIDFVGLNFTHPQHNQYAYILEGFDEEWNYVGNKTSATYTNLDPGEYTFMVKGSNNDGIWNEEPTILRIAIEPALWKTWWAKTSYALFALLLIFVFMRIKGERIRIENQLKLERIARENEHELNRLKEQFFTNISHEIRTPLSLIMAPIESLLSSANHTVHDQLSIVHRNAKRMMRMINELMDFQKLEKLKMTLEVSQTDISGFVLTLAESFKDASDNRNINLEVDLEPGSLYGWIDKMKVETILFNLLANAFKFVYNNGNIQLILRRSQVSGDKPGSDTQWLELIVKDDGIGIAPNEITHIFERFYQAKSAEMQQISGSGLGLALTKKLVELHHGTITVESIPCQETIFTVTLPIDRSAYAVSEIKEGKSLALSSSSRIPIKYNQATIPSSQILVVEDNDELRNYLVSELEKNFKVMVAANGEEGVRLAEEELPDLIVSDIIMPLKNGIELCRELKADVKTSHIPIILLTARDSVEDRIEGIAIGADAYLPKPFSIQLLNTQIEKLIEIRKNLYKRFSQEVYLTPAKLVENELDKEFISKVTDYILANIQNTQLSVESMSEQFNMSRGQVYRKIKALTGKSAIEFIRVVRLKEAIKLMDTRTYTLAEIAYKLGFASPSYFAKSFKLYYGKAPSEYVRI